MDLTLILVTLLSLALAAVMTTVAWRLTREERRRSDARVAALAAELQGSARTPLPAATERSTPRAADDLPLNSRPLASGELFAASTPAGIAWRRAAAALVVVGVAASLGFVYVESRSSSAARAGQAPQKSAARERAVDGVTPLELTALTHERSGRQLTVRGIVGNPATAGDVRDVTAVVFLFDRDGHFMMSGRADIDRLAPGAQSPFVVTIADAGDVGRYRVSFRSGDRIVPHVDRRERSVAEAR
jgi:hypothetical protein